MNYLDICILFFFVVKFKGWEFKSEEQLGFVKDLELLGPSVGYRGLGSLKKALQGDFSF